MLPYIWFCAVLLFLSYAIGLFFTLRTHAAVIWNTDIDEKKADRLLESTPNVQHFETRGPTPTPFPTLSRQATRTDVRDTQLYRRILGQSLKQLSGSEVQSPISPSDGKPKSATMPLAASESISEMMTPHVVPPKSRDFTPAIGSPTQRGIHLSGLSEEDNRLLQRQVAEMAATAATVAARDATKAPRTASQMAISTAPMGDNRPPTRNTSRAEGDGHIVRPEDGVPSTQAKTTMADTMVENAGGHDAPNWSRTKSVVVLLTATLAYAIIAEILVNTVDAVLENVDIDEKFLGITLFALVPNTTEFLVRRISSFSLLEALGTNEVDRTPYPSP